MGQNECVSLRIPLGGLGPDSPRDTAGSIYIYEETPTPDLGSPDTLNYNFTSSQVITSYSSGAISSIVTPEVTAAVIIFSPSSYEIEILPDSSGTTLPDRTVRVERQDSNGEDILITDTQTYNSITSSTVYRYQWDSVRNGWYLSEGVSGGNYLRKTFNNETKNSSTLVVTKETYSLSTTLLRRRSHSGNSFLARASQHLGSRDRPLGQRHSCRISRYCARERTGANELPREHRH